MSSYVSLSEMRHVSNYEILKSQVDSIQIVVAMAPILDHEFLPQFICEMQQSDQILTEHSNTYLINLI